MDRLETQFADDLEFVLLDIDDSSLNATREQYGITGRSQYVLLDTNDAVVLRWYGPLDFESVRADIEAFLRR